MKQGLKSVHKNKKIQKNPPLKIPCYAPRLVEDELRVKAQEAERVSQCRSRNCPGFDASIFRHNGMWGAADEALLNIVHKKSKKSPF